MHLVETEHSRHAPLSDAGQAVDHLADRKNLLQLVHLRWVAVAGQLATILTTHFALGIRLPLREMLTLLAALVLFNVVSWWRTRRVDVGDRELFVGMLVDVAVLSGQLFHSGGITNPFIFLFLPQVAVGAVLLRPAYAWAIVVLTCAAFVVLTRWHRPLYLAGAADPTASIYYIGGLLLCFVLNASLLMVSIARIERNLRQRDARLADLRQRDAEEEHILRMGLLASGAAHELGTPLATLSVIVGDWARMAPFTGEPELREEIEEMQVQLRRCKSIVSSILLSAGEARGEAPAQTTLHAFFDDLVDDWRGTRPVQGLSYERDDLPDRPIVSDLALRQMIGNVLDNALEAAPQRSLRLSVGCEDGDETLVVRVQDHGPGFAPAMLEHLGKPYQSSKGKPGGGLGLFLAVNVARTLGGGIVARNRAEGGAEVEIRLPLSALTLDEEVAHAA